MKKGNQIEKAGGISSDAVKGKTVSVSVDDLFKAWKANDLRARWLPDADISIRKATQGESMRLTWVDGETHVDVDFYAKGNSKSQVTVQHSKLREKNDVPRMKTYWSSALQNLKVLLEDQK